VYCATWYELVVDIQMREEHLKFNASLCGVVTILYINLIEMCGEHNNLTLCRIYVIVC
jgi:hypothetical protein